IPDGTRLAAVAGRTPRPQGAVLETTDRVETARIVMLVEGQPFAVTKAVTIPQLGVEAQRIAVTQGGEDLAAVVDLVEGKVAARQRRLQIQALGMAARGQDPAVQGRLGPADVGLVVGVAVAFGLEEVEDLVDGVVTGLDLIPLSRQAIAEARILADGITEGQPHAQAVDRVAGDAVVQLVIVGLAVEGVVTQADS